MKRSAILCMAVACMAVAVSCSKDNAVTESAEIKTGNTEFVFKAPANFNGAMTKAGNSFDPAKLSILAFRNDGSGNTADYIFYENVQLLNARWENNMIKASADLEWGSYHFIPVYDTQSNAVTMSTLNNQALTENLYFDHIVGAGADVPEIFTLNTPVNQLASPHTVSLDGQTQTVNMTLKRSVGRVDVYFIGAERDANGVDYHEVAGKDVFDGYTPSLLNMDFTDINTRMTITGFTVDNGTQNPVQNYSYVGTNLVNRNVYGNSATNGILDGSFYAYDNVTSGDILDGSVYFVGPYLFAKNATGGTIGLTVKVANTSSPASLRTIELSNDIPVNRNAVTIVKIYVLSDSIFSTRVDFEVEFETVWEDPNYVEDVIF